MNRKLILKSLGVIAGLFIFAGIVSASKNKNVPKSEVKSVQIESSPSPFTPTSSANPNITIAKVKNVIDGDTFTLESGEVVRLIGVDTPETVHPSKPVQCYGKEAGQKLQELIEDKEIKLEKDISETDRYNRLLRYVYLGDVFVNEYLVNEGYAKSSSYPPDIKYQNKFVEAQKKAQEDNKGLWNVSTCPVATVQPVIPKPTNSQTYTQPTLATKPPTVVNGGSYVCDCSKTCTKMSCSEAQYQLTTCGCGARDADKDGVACDSQCQ